MFQTIEVQNFLQAPWRLPVREFFTLDVLVCENWKFSSTMVKKTDIGLIEIVLIMDVLDSEIFKIFLRHGEEYW